MKQQISQQVPSGQSRSGTSMDQKVESRSLPWNKIVLLSVLILALGGTAWASMSLSGESSFRLDGNTLRVAEVQAGTFEDFIPIRGRITPRTTVFLDAIDGGRVDRVFVEDGDILEQGDLIISLSNSALQLSVINSESQVAEQLNNMRTIELSLEQNRLSNAREIANIQYRIGTLKRDLEGDRNLVTNGGISRRELQNKENELIYQEQLLGLALESQATDTEMQAQQLEAQSITSQRLEQSLEVARKNLDDLNIRAPFSGKLSGFDAEVGQSINAGGRLGQIDVPEEFKIQANIDEFYINRVDLDQTVTYQVKGETYQAEIKKIYPQVNNAQFQVDILFSTAQPLELRRGQTLQVRLTLGDESDALLIPNGAFFQDTGGNWIFVINADGTEAVRRNVVMGRRNSSDIEILEGLEAGEQVVVSSYSAYQAIDRLTISQN
jgi:HlyD family secretion protein